MEIQIELSLPGSVAQVMQALTKEQELRAWSGEDAVVEWKAGGRCEWFGGWASGTLPAVSETEFEWNWKCGDWEEGRSAPLHITLKAGAGETLLRMQQTGLQTEEECERLRRFWMEEVWTPLEDYLMVRYHRA